ncbi:SDR family oxidoreductase [Aureibacter tunicatorum]|uniref:NADP-dependent 3-hydroxy acid dehydrogenase YdfG n=1 Tax=Aureibacter tunicatorum TaxID=866807 RepID=A0AAE4BU62_9BACT|nr:SDR family oxidoreductase [Aureibacter tunicatorum]MDR6240372.1 NADP-dependent 3-hydroxy acid dehydrogenase YdfG [Aureibacter tunicatorum]BDD05747.1 SDR family oxidoreductase [Aureibacter tunicatorum]
MRRKVALVTGCGKGIGRAIVEKLTEKYFVVGLSRTVVDLGLDYFKMIACDISDEQQVKKRIAEIIEDFGQVDVLVNNAGIGAFGVLEQIESDVFKQMMDVNVQGTFLMNKYVVPHMKAARVGHIVQIASDVSKRTFAEGSVYCASKYAQDAMTSSLRAEVREFNVKVSSIYPGLTDTHFAASTPGEEHKQGWLSPYDVADAVNYILSSPKHVVVDELMIHPMSQDY